MSSDRRAPNPFATPEADDGPPPPAPFDPEADAPLASRDKRFMGALTDNVLYVGAALPGIIIFVSEGDTEALRPWIVGGVPVTLLWLYQMFLVATTGQSVAKRWMKMKIVRVDGSPVNFLTGVVLRSWIPLALGLLPTAGRVFGIIDAALITREDLRCLHDHIANTKVIDVS